MGWSPYCSISGQSSGFQNKPLGTSTSHKIYISYTQIYFSRFCKSQLSICYVIIHLCRQPLASFWETDKVSMYTAHMKEKFLKRDGNGLHERKFLLLSNILYLPQTYSFNTLEGHLINVNWYSIWFLKSSYRLEDILLIIYMKITSGEIYMMSLNFLSINWLNHIKFNW